ncbi:transglutaminase-like domain-containing protein [Conyzicola nivalis]|uniref:Cysteine protease n=1 Tax=Conyzicola nivalis TaxID=1477021 RepID=A0A916SBZ0_9MICO|nr:transglutaminase-like domain-containing protein [Conyzicola nivalis]GGA92462.1 cysteine protease [Conyzicola nivalis]
MSAAYVVWNTLFLWAGIAVASVAFWPIYQSPSIVLLVAVTTLAGSAIAILGAAFRWSSAIVLAATVVAFLLLGVPLAVPLQALYGVLPTLDGLWQLVSGVALGWKQLLTITLPVGNYQALLVPAFVLVLGVSVVALSTALRAKRGGIAAAGPIALYLAALALGPDYATAPLVLSIALIVVTLVWLMWRRWHARREAIHRLAADARSTDGTGAPVPSDHRLFGIRTIVATTVILAIASAAGVAGAVFAPPSKPREVARSAVVQPFDPRDYVSPLAGFRRYLQSETANEVLFSVSGLPSDGRIRIATLDTYDGIVYSVGSATVTSESGSFTRVPYRFDQSAVAGETVVLDVTVEGYSGVWVPTAGQLEAIDFAGDRATSLRNAFYYNDTAGTAAVIGGLRPGDEYSLEAVIPRQPGTDAVGALRPGSAVVPGITVLPEETEIVLDRYVDGVEGEGNRLAAMLEGLKAEGYISHGISDDEPASRSGHSADRITQLLTDQRMIGDAEQYSVTAALMARQLGFPARVVFGFAPEVDDTGATEVTGDAVTAWIEVDTQQYGWVSIDPNPPVREIPEEQPEEPTTVSRPQSVIPPPPLQPDRQDDQTPQESTPDEPAPDDAWLAIALLVARIVGWVALGLAVLVSPFLMIVAAKVRRRRLRRRAATPLARISGGWQEYRDAIVDHGVDLSPSSTRREVALTVGGSQPAILAAISDRAVFSPREPSKEEADKVWKAVTELSAGLDAGTTRWQRLKALVSLRSLGTVARGARDSRRTGRPAEGKKAAARRGSDRQGATP